MWTRNRFGISQAALATAAVAAALLGTFGALQWPTHFGHVADVPRRQAAPARPAEPAPAATPATRASSP